MPVRRSARIRSLQKAVDEPLAESATAHNNDNNINKTNNQKNLDPVMEHEEPSAAAESSADPQPIPAATTVQTPKRIRVQKKSPAKTPTTSTTRPAHEDMHPSKVHQSTTKQPDSGLILGFNPVKKDAHGNVVNEHPVHNTPSKTNASPASTYYGTPAFEFKFASHESQLSDEAKKLMESVREDVARIKAKMVQEKTIESNSETSQTADRRIAKPKGKAGRFSDAHMAEFKKMDSIAGHASAFRAAPGRFQPVQTTLKRTNSKARLDEPEGRTSPAKATPKPSGPATPAAKRVKYDKTEEKPTNRTAITKPAIARPRSSVRGSLMTPTRSSMARASSASLKPARTSMIPSLARSPVSKPADAPSTPRTDFNPRFKSNIPTLSNLKSILRRHQPLFSKDPVKIAAGTHRAAPDFTSDLLLRPSRESSQEPAATPSPKKRVEFRPCTNSHQPEEIVSPSPSKVPTLTTFSYTSNVVYPVLPSLTPDRGQAQKPATIRPVRQSEAPVESLLPEIPGMPHGISYKKRHRAGEDELDRENVPPDTPSGERSAKRLKASAPSPAKMPASSPVKARSHTPIRSGSVSNRNGTPASARPKSRGTLSISRLNMLAQPKHRS